jgi:adenylyltransferase/sulfurtransferase
MLSTEQISRWSCQVLLPEIGLKGQGRLLDSSVLIAGVGALGCGVAGYLAAAGVGRLLLADHDIVELGNLHRQMLYSTADLGAPKVIAAETRLKSINPAVVIDAYQEELDSRRTRELAARVDVVVDCTDSYESRYAVNSACLEAGIPLVHGACVGFSGQVMTVQRGSGPCFRCVCPEAPPPAERLGCSQVGIIGPVAGIVASIMAAEVFKLLLGIPGTLSGILLSIDAQYNEFHQLTPSLLEDCPDCSPYRAAIPSVLRGSEARIPGS